jgi:hypothetical protein
MKSLRKKFPDTLILPALGNNDQMFQYQVPGHKEIKQMYYQDVLDLWFGEHAPRKNKLFAHLTDLNETFHRGGYYRFDLDSALSYSYKLSVISLNTIYFHKKNKL